MSQPFVCMLSVDGEPSDVAEFIEHFSVQWAEMERDNTIFQGFRWLQGSQPETTFIAENRPLWRFLGDGKSPETYAALISTAFPKLRVHLSAADSSRNEYLAVAIAAKNGKFENIDLTNEPNRRYGMRNGDLALSLIKTAQSLNIPS